VHPGTDNLTIPQYVTGVTSGSMPAGTTPLQVADRIEASAAAANRLLLQVRFPIRTNSAELAETTNDIARMTELGRYYAAKIRGATGLALYRATRDPRHQSLAVKNLEAAAQAWDAYADLVQKAYGPAFWTNRVGRVDWQELTAEVHHDIEIAQAPPR
jgi:hypothetical protein